VRLRAELIPTIPASVRVVARNAVWTYGRLTAAARPLPDFLIIGAQKAGTTALYSYLREHPALAGPPWKEVSFFDRHFWRGAAWYRGHFPNTLYLRRVRARAGVEPIVGEASPGYLFHPFAPERAAALLHEVRLIALVRNPIDRSLSHYHHEVALGREPLPFEQALEQEETRMEGELERMRDPRYFSHAWWNFTYLARGRYADQLERWLDLVPRERLLVLPSEELLERPRETYKQVLEFLGAPPHELDAYPRIFVRAYGDMDPQTRGRLREYYAEPNRRLYDLLGRDFGWS
jgi:sulfotransferase family protein